jgi:hypothetical protein
MSTRVKYFNVYGKAVDKNGVDHYVTVVGKFEQTRERSIVHEQVPVEVKPNCFVDGVLTYEPKIMKRKLTLGVSICHPSDPFDEQVGINIAKARIERGEDLGSLVTTNVTMLTEDAIMAELIVKLNHICETIDEYIS